MSSREDLEKFASEYFVAPDFSIDKNGRYKTQLMRDAEAVWKASRAALAVESCHAHPELILTDEDRAYEQGVQNQLKRVRAAGIPVKQP
ncbi:hypothetical protein [Pseudomonas luteola]|uniref:Uncharacterized protein n=1 Tax=Pseudomonas luteola TaxID=47886 RepID=A0ABS0MUU5_PSELU|nr:hypothetical protein [Pseudomonas luteola]MBH3440487.1 hypothetical protein [Pseudomonas luteola]